MRRFVYRLLPLTLLIFSLTAFAKAPEKILLRFNFVEGQVFVDRLTMDQEFTQTILGQTIQLKQTSRMEIVQEVQKVDEFGNGDVKLTYRSIYYAMDGPMATIVFDSKNPPDTMEPVFYHFAALLGAEIIVRFSPTGEVLELMGFEELLDNMILTLDLPEEAYEDLMNVYSKEKMVELIKQNNTTFPQQPVGVGDSWVQWVEINDDLPLIFENTYSIKKIKKDKITINVSSTIKNNIQNPSIDMGFMKMHYEIKGTQKGKMIIDKVTGQINRADLTQNIAGTITMDGFFQDMGLEDIPELNIPEIKNTWPISAKSKIRIERI